MECFGKHVWNKMTKLTTFTLIKRIYCIYQDKGSEKKQTSCKYNTSELQRYTHCTDISVAYGSCDLSFLHGDCCHCNAECIILKKLLTKRAECSKIYMEIKYIGGYSHVKEIYS